MGARLVLDLNPSGSSSPQSMISIDGMLYFTADLGSSSEEGQQTPDTDDDLSSGEEDAQETAPLSTNQIGNGLALLKSDGTTEWLGLSGDSLVVGYDTKNNKLIYRESSGSTNTLKSYDTSTSTSSSIGTFGGSNTSWQAGGIGAVDSYSRTAFQLRPNATSTIYKINLDDGTETSVSISNYITTIAWDSKEQKLYGLYDSNSNGAYRVAEINTSGDTCKLINNNVQWKLNAKINE